MLKDDKLNNDSSLSYALFSISMFQCQYIFADNNLQINVGSVDVVINVAYRTHEKSQTCSITQLM